MVLRYLRRITVEPVLFLYMLGSFLQFTAVQQLIRAKVCATKFDDSVCSNLSNHNQEEKEVITESSHWVIILNVALTVPSVISSLFLGSWSDRVGRRIIILLPTSGTIVYCGFLIASACYITSSMWLIIIGQAILGATGAYPILTSAVFSYLGDITTEENRTWRFGILESMTFAGSCVGLLSSGFVIDAPDRIQMGFVAAFVYVMLCEILIILYVLLWLRESVPECPEEGQEGDMGGMGSSNRCAMLFKLEHSKKTFAAVFRKREHGQRLQVILLVICLFIFELVGTGERDTTVYYVQKSPLSFDSRLLGLYMGFTNLAKWAGLILVLPLVHWMGLGDPLIAATGTGLRMGGYTLMAFATTKARMFAVIAFMAFSGIPAACTRAMLSTLVSPSEQGSLFSFTAAMETLTGFLGSLVFNAVFPATLDILQGGFIYLLMAGLLIIPVILLVWVRDLQKLDVSYDIQSDEEHEEEASKSIEDRL